MRTATDIRAMAMLIFVATAGFADAAEIRVYTTGAPAEAVKAIAADVSAKSGDQIAFTVGQPETIQRRLAAGEHADVVILPASDIAVLSQAGTLRADSVVSLARVGIGVVVRAGAKQPDISSAAAIRAMLLKANAIVYPDPRTGGGSAGRVIEHMIERFGISKTVKSKLMLKSAIGGGVDLVAAGKAEVGLFNVSEIMPIKGVTLVGTLPAALQNYIVFAAGLPAGNPAPQAASFIAQLADPAAAPQWQKAGLEPVAPKR